MPAKDGFQLQERDVELLLRPTFELGLVTLDHLVPYIGATRHTVYKRVAKLEANGFVSRKTRPPAKGMWQLGPEGIRVLIERGHAPESIAGRRLRAHELKPLGLAHTLFIVDIHAKILHQAKDRPEKLVHWQQDQRIWDETSWPDHLGRKKKYHLRPDAHFIIEHTKRPQHRYERHFFLEADRSTMSHERMEQKIRAYREYHDSEGFREKYPTMQSFRVIVVTETCKRAENLRCALEHMLPTTKLQRAYRFMALPDLTLDAILPQVATPVDETHPHN